MVCLLMNQIPSSLWNYLPDFKRRGCELTHQMVVNSARQQPVSGVVSYHFSSTAAAGEKTDCVCVVALRGQDLTMEMNWMHVHL